MARFIAGDITQYLQTDTTLVLNEIGKIYFQNFEENYMGCLLVDK